MTSERLFRTRRRAVAGAFVFGGILLTAAACTPEEMQAYQNLAAQSAAPQAYMTPMPSTTLVPSTTAPAPTAPKTTVAPSTAPPATTLALPASSDGDALRALNADRAAAGLAPLAPNASLNAKAQSWANHLASVGALSHSNLTDGVDPNWWLLGENVGTGPSLANVEASFMQSAAHRDNILNGQYNAAGTGVAVAANGAIYIVQSFAQY